MPLCSMTCRGGKSGGLPSRACRRRGSVGGATSTSSGSAGDVSDSILGGGSGKTRWSGGASAFAERRTKAAASFVDQPSAAMIKRNAATLQASTSTGRAGDACDSIPGGTSRTTTWSGGGSAQGGRRSKAAESFRDSPSTARIRRSTATLQALYGYMMPKDCAATIRRSTATLKASCGTRAAVAWVTLRGSRTASANVGAVALEGRAVGMVVGERGAGTAGCRSSMRL
mmetsp:Transcript_57791/g.161266  ORF Transcript_57791/g.161266 Transcript_57791/m.161266 type:complete len:228 (+) Transcript_57791:388-1071(+)